LGHIVVGVDIGTSKVSAVVGQINKESRLEILGYGMEQCIGVKKVLLLI
jgi:cell division protein FtsA